MYAARERSLLVANVLGRAARPWLVAFGLVLGLAAPTPVAATAVSSASASLTLTLTGVTGADPDDLIVYVFGHPDDGGYETGNARGGGSYRVGDVFEVFSSIYAEPTPVISGAGGYAEIWGYLNVYNADYTWPNEPLHLEFLVEWSVSAFAVVDDPSAEETARASAEIIGQSGFFQGAGVHADTASATPGGSFSGSETFTFVWPGSNALVFIMLVSTRAEALAVPVAGTLPLMAAGLLGLGLMGVRRKG